MPIDSNCESEMKFINLRRQFESPDLKEMEASEMLPRLKWAIKEHTSYEMEYIKGKIEEKRKKLNKMIYENKRLEDVYLELRLKEKLTRKSQNEH